MRRTLVNALLITLPLVTFKECIIMKNALKIPIKMTVIRSLLLEKPLTMR